MLKGFKAFISRGNVIDLAVGVVIGAAFGDVVTAFTDGILGPIIGWILPGGNLADASFTIAGSEFLYGSVIQALINFVLIAAAIYFLVVVPVNKMRGTATDEPTNDEKMVALLEQIANR
jgi:large conductance mechanosensitive channel